MKRFKEYIKPEEEFISNSHGKHARIKSKDYYKEDTVSNFEKDYLPKNENVPIMGSPGNGSTHIDELHNTHPHSDKGAAAHKKFTAGSETLTKALLDREKTKEPFTKDSFDGNLASHLDNHGFTKLKHPLDTYSGVGFNIKNVTPVGKSKEGNPVYRQPTYMSSSMNKNVAASFARTSAKNDRDGVSHIFHWHHKEGDNVGVVGNNSNYPEEQEVLVPRTDSSPEKYHIEHMSTSSYGDKWGNTVLVHHVKRIPESETIKD